MAATTTTKRNKRRFGGIRRLPSGRYQACYTGPDTIVRNAPTTFDTHDDAETWLVDVRRTISRGEWGDQAADQQTRKAVKFGEYAAAWVADRTLKPRSRAHYTSLLAHQLAQFDQRPLKAITAHEIRTWHSGMGDRTPTLRAHAFALLRTILGEAVRDGEILSNPANIRGAGSSRRVVKIRPATFAELDTIVNAMPQRLQLMVLLAAWGGLRFGELTELRRGDLDATNGIVRLRRAVVHVNGEFVVGTPKSDAGTRDVAIPPHLLPAVRAHLAASISGGKDGLLFPAHDGVSHMGASTLYRSYYAARDLAGRPDLRFHDLRHTGATLAAATGATLAELMARLGHSSPQMALRYQHASADRDKTIAEALSAMVR